MKKKDFLKNLKSLDKAGLESEARRISEELMKLRFKKASMQLTNSSQLAALKKDLARVNTFKNSAMI